MSSPAKDTILYDIAIPVRVRVSYFQTDCPAVQLVLSLGVMCRCRWLCCHCIYISTRRTHTISEHSRNSGSLPMRRGAAALYLIKLKPQKEYVNEQHRISFM